MPPRPAPQPGRQGLPIRLDRFIGKPVLQVRRQSLRGRVPGLGLQSHRFHTDGFQGGRNLGIHLARRLEAALANLDEDLKDIFAAKRGDSGQQGVESGPQTVDIAGRSQLIQLAHGLFRAHVSRRTHNGTRLRGRDAPRRARPQQTFLGGGRTVGATHRLGQAPIDDERFAVFAEHDIIGLEIAVQHAAGMGITHGVAGRDKLAQ